MRINILLLSLPALLALGCAPEGSYARAYQIKSLDQGIGGPKAMARPGDLVLENDRIRLAILGTRTSMGPHTSGGSLVDADLQRPDPRFSQGRGIDQLAEVFPTVNLNVTSIDEENGTVEIVKDGSGGGPAIVCTEGPEQSFITLLDALWGLQWEGERPYFRIRTDYILEPGSSAVLIRSYAIFADEAGCQEDLESVEADYSEDGLPLLDLALSRNEGGLVFGDFYLQGGHVDVFTPGYGFDEESFVDALLEAGSNTFIDPIQVPFLAGTADRVSYGLMPAEGDIYVPMFTASQTVAVGAGVEGDGSPTRFQSGERYHYDRYFAVGRGDVGSVVDALLQARGAPRGRVEGYVVERSTGVALSGIRVFAFPVDPETGEVAEQPYLEWTTDVGEDVQKDGSFGGSLPPGKWELMVHQLGRPDSDRTRITVQDGKTVQLVLESPRPGEIRFQIWDETGSAVPAKLTLFADGDSSRDPDLGDGFISGDPVHVVFTADGSGSMAVPPGRYYAVASRGLEYDIDISEPFQISANSTVDLDLQVVRSIDTTGWVSADLHVHAERSHDSGVSLPDRVTTMVAEGVEFMASTDHDAITDYRPAILDLGVSPWITASIGLEVTTLEVGHFLGFPLLNDHLADAGGALDWTGLTPQQIIDGLRDLGDPSPDREPVVFVGHPRDGILGYFDQYGLNPYKLDGDDLSFEQNTIEETLAQAAVVSANPILNEANFSTDFDAFEVLNGKRQELIRTPTRPEILAYLEEPDAYPIYEMMSRTMEEQQALIDDAALVDPGERVYTLGPGYEGVLDDWFHLLNLGYDFVALGNSDTHGKTSTEAGCPRNYVQADTDDAGFLDEQAIARAVKEGRVVASSGPFVRFWANQEQNGPGTLLAASGPVTLGIEVQTPAWFDVDRVELYENGTLIREWTGDEIQAGTVNLFAEEEVEPAKDSWYVVVALGQDDLAPVFTAVDLAPIQLDDVVSGALSEVEGPASSFAGAPAPVPRTFPVHPYAVTNPIRIDVNDNGVFDAPGVPDWWVVPTPLPEDEE